LDDVYLFWGVRVLLFLLDFCGLALVVPVYLGAPYAFINKVFLLIKKKMMSIFLGIIPGYLKIPFSNGCQALAKQSRWQPCQG
jgi:hypothetical protein